MSAAALVQRNLSTELIQILSQRWTNVNPKLDLLAVGENTVKLLIRAWFSAAVIIKCAVIWRQPSKVEWQVCVVTPDPELGHVLHTFQSLPTRLCSCSR